ncbi:hypothetical protein J6590_058191 [Homalodisca vitripennis]|nr:hypothetical protein J6590_058191 [Homalodisca vitripennis]
MKNVNRFNLAVEVASEGALPHADVLEDTAGHQTRAIIAPGAGLGVILRSTVCFSPSIIACRPDRRCVGRWRGAVQCSVRVFACEMPDVTRSDSQRSDASHKPRVSFNRDVHVKRIGLIKDTKVFNQFKNTSALLQLLSVMSNMVPGGAPIFHSDLNLRPLKTSIGGTKTSCTHTNYPSCQGTPSALVIEPT